MKRILLIVLLLVFSFGVTATAQDASRPTDDEILRVIRDLEDRVETLEAEVDRLMTLVTVESSDRQSSSPDNQVVSSGDGWILINNNWDFRYGRLNDQGFGLYVLTAEVKRTKGSASMAMFTITFYDDSDRIIATGSASLASSVQAGQTRTLQFMLDSEPRGASKYRVQVDVEM